jgi:hypothetical protein
LSFSAKVTDTVSGKSTTATINVLVGPDTISVLNVTYALAKSRLQVSVQDSVPGGVAAMTVIPLDSNGLPISAAIAMFFDPTQNAYILPMNFLVNPVPNAVTINSSLGGTLTTAVQKIR